MSSQAKTAQISALPSELSSERHLLQHNAGGNEAWAAVTSQLNFTQTKKLPWANALFQGLQIGRKPFRPTPSSSAASSTDRRRESDISFPNDDETRPFITPVQPNCASESTFCEQVDNYPTHLIKQNIDREAQKYSALFGVDVVVPGVENRFNGIEEEVSLCRSTEELIFPKAGLTRENNWLFIVNVENYQQGIRIERCLSNNTECDFTSSFPNNYRSECRQKHIYRQLVSIDKNGNTKKDLFQMPSCCQCVLLPIDRS